MAAKHQAAEVKLTISQQVVERERVKQEFREITTRYRKRIKVLDESIMAESMSGGKTELPFKER
jgi:hypothetical protein